MRKILLWVIVLVAFACNDSKWSEKKVNYWTFNHQHDPLLEEASDRLITQYAKLLQRVSEGDTVQVFAATRDFITLTDTLQNQIISSDTSLQKVFTQELGHLSAELKGLVMEQYLNDIYLSFNMTSIQLLHLLGAIGYQKQSIYIFNTGVKKGEMEEDGFTWLAYTKKSHNPYLIKENQEVNAIQILQEANSEMH